MINLGKIPWIGATGKTYSYDSFKGGTNFTEYTGNFIFARKTERGWDAIFIYEGNIEDVSNSQGLDCIDSKDFTHIHAHLNRNDKDRRYEYEDLLSAHSEALKVNGGCN